MEEEVAWQLLGSDSGSSSFLHSAGSRLQFVLQGQNRWFCDVCHIVRGMNTARISSVEFEAGQLWLLKKVVYLLRATVAGYQDRLTRVHYLLIKSIPYRVEEISTKEALIAHRRMRGK